MSQSEEKKASNFIEQIVEKDLAEGKIKDQIVTRFPPEPNGYLHVGHAKSICLNFGIAKKFNGRTNLRFDDTNPVKEDQEYIDSIQRDIKWLGFDWGEHLHFTSDYFEKIYKFAIQLIKQNLAYVDDLNPDEMREYRGTLTEPGKNSPYRDRSVEENLNLLERMKNGEFSDGSKTLRAKIDMSHPNLSMRDPVMYRIKHFHHHRTGDKWCIYPSYDFAHGQSDSIEGITHSICTLEFESHRPLYNWFIEKLDIFPSHQYEFARLNLTYTVMSKRKLLKLVEDGIVDGWDDPRMPTISGLRRRGYTPGSIRHFADLIGVSKSNSTVDYAMLEFCIREELNKTANRIMVVQDPIKLIITNYPEGQTEDFEATNNPEDSDAGTRKVTFSRELYIERNDFMPEAPKKYFRLTLGREVRLKHAYYVTATSYETDENGQITTVYCTYDPETRGGDSPDSRKVKGTIQWISIPHATPVTVRLYDHLFSKENPDEIAQDQNFTVNINHDSLKIITAQAETFVRILPPETRVQFMRQGYFVTDIKDHTSQNPVFNKIVGLKDTWGKMQKRQ